MEDARWPMEFLSTKQTSEKWEISARRIQILCAENRISGAVRVGKTWIIEAILSDERFSVNTFGGNRTVSLSE